MTGILNAGRALLALPFAALASAPAFAQTPTELPEISIYANQAPIEANRTGTSVSVMTGTDLRARGFANLSDGLRLVPGLAVSQSGTRGSYTQIRVRGAESNHLLVLVDGVPVNDFANGDFDFADYALEDIERVEVLRGPQSGLYGANAHAGVIAVVTKSGRGMKTPEATLRLEGGSMNTRAGGASLRGAYGPAYGSITVDGYGTDGYNVSRFGSERDGSRATHVTAKAGVDLTPELNVEGVFRFADRFAATDSQPFFGPFEGLAFNSANDYNSKSTWSGRGAATWTALGGQFVQRLSGSRFDERRSDDDVVNGFFRSHGIRDNVEYKATAFANTQALGGEKHALSVLADWQRETLTSDSASYAFDPAAYVFWAAGAERRRTGIAGEYALGLSQGLNLTGAVRRDFNSGFADATTWRGTASQLLPWGTRLHGSVGTGVTNPTFIEQFGFFVATFIGNAGLRPERSLGWDGGIEQTFLNGRFIADVTYFESKFEDKITLVTTPAFLSMPVNAVGTSPRRGVEVTAKANPVPWLWLSAGYTYTDARLPNGTLEIRRPRHMASASATATFMDGRARATVHGSYNGEMPDTWFKFPLTTVTMAAYTVVGARLEYDFNQWGTAFVRAENILNADYEEVWSYKAPKLGIYGGVKVKVGG